MKKAIFLDRDGTLNVEKEYLYQEKDLEFEKGTVEALSILKDLGYLLIVVTNQSGIARQYYTEEDLKHFHQAFQKKLSVFGLKIDKFYYRSEEHTSELQSRQYLVCRLLLEKKK